VEVLEGTSIRATAVANIFRQDLRDAGTGTGNYGFSIAMPAALKTGQPRQLSIRIQGTTFTLSGSPKTITCTVPAVYNGNFEIANCTKISGWISATNYPDSAVVVEIVEGATVITSTVANMYRGDLKNGTKNYGFSIVPPASLKTGQARVISVRVKDAAYVLPGSTKTITCASPAQYAGDFELADCNTIKGWAWSIANPNVPVTVEVLEGTSIRATAVANIFRQDLRDAGTGTGNYGFSIAMPAALKTGQPRQLSIRIQGTTFTLSGSPKTITCAVPAVYNGNFEIANCTKISGWISATNYPDSAVVVEIVEGATVITSTVANMYRGDLKNGTKNYGFSIVLPESLKNGQERVLSVRVKGAAYVLPGSARTVTCVSSARIVENVDDSERQLSSIVSAIDWELKISPNPTRGIVSVSCGSLNEKAVLTIFALNGRKLNQRELSNKGEESKELIDLSSYPDGVYLFKMETQNKSEIKRVILIH
jgi:hypothetical protein